jgi:hypothetical protein
MLHRQPTIEEMRKALEEAARIPPEQYFRDMVLRGLIDSEGRLTRLYGGDAEPEPEALEYLKTHESENGHRS